MSDFAQFLFLVLLLEINPGGLRGLYGVTGINPSQPCARPVPSLYTITPPVPLIFSFLPVNNLMVSGVAIPIFGKRKLRFKVAQKLNFLPGVYKPGFLYLGPLPSWALLSLHSQSLG